MTKTPDPARALLGWAAKHLTESPTEISPCPRESRKRCAEYSGTRHTVGRSPRSVADIAAGLGRMAG